jgi:hypothetical protein
MAWAFKYYKMRKKPSPLMQIMQEKLNKLNWEETRELSDELGISYQTLWGWRTGEVMNGNGLTMSLLCIYFGIIDGERPHLTEDEQVALEIRYKNMKKRQKKKLPTPNLNRARMRVVR